MLAMEFRRTYLNIFKRKISQFSLLQKYLFIADKLENSGKHEEENENASQLYQRQLSLLFFCYIDGPYFQWFYSRSF
jgi:HD superfamily phosphohydrolase YqeK